MDVIAIHEAGHAWAYYSARKPLRYVTIRPREPGVLGVCRSWKPRSIERYQLGLIASAGPVAEAIHSLQADEDPDPHGERTFESYLTVAVLFGGGHDDYAASAGLLDEPSVTAWLRDELVKNWAGITTLAGALCERGTVSGRDAAEFLRG